MFNRCRIPNSIVEMASFTIVGSQSGSGNISINAPSGTEEGDLLLFLHHRWGATAGLGIPTGFDTLVPEQILPGSGNAGGSFQVGSRVATSGDTSGSFASTGPHSASRNVLLAIRSSIGWDDLSVSVGYSGGTPGKGPTSLESLSAPTENNGVLMAVGASVGYTALTTMSSSEGTVNHPGPFQIKYQTTSDGVPSAVMASVEGVGSPSHVWLCLFGIAPTAHYTA